MCLGEHSRGHLSQQIGHLVKVRVYLTQTAVGLLAPGFAGSDADANHATGTRIALGPANADIRR